MCISKFYYLCFFKPSSKKQRESEWGTELQRQRASANEFGPEQAQLIIDRGSFCYASVKRQAGTYFKS